MVQRVVPVERDFDVTGVLEEGRGRFYAVFVEAPPCPQYWVCVARPEESLDGQVICYNKGCGLVDGS